MWIGLHNEWQYVKRIDVTTLWITLILLFCSSLFPYTTKIVSEHFYSTAAQVAYGIVANLTTLANILMTISLIKNPYNKRFQQEFRFRQKWLIVNLLVKLIGIIIAIFVYPPAAMFTVLIAAFLIALPAHTVEIKKNKYY